jgi:hypothetical protein
VTNASRQRPPEPFFRVGANSMLKRN